MVLNLLQRFTLDEARELIFKTFGYFSSTDRITPLLREMEEYQKRIDAANSFSCDYKHSAQDFREFCKWKRMYVEMRTLAKTLKRQSGKKKKDAMPPEAIEFLNKAKQYRHNMERFGCDVCKRYQNHKKELEVLERYEKKVKKLQKEIEFQKDIYWQKFLAHKDILETTQNLADDYPTQRGKTAMALRNENELYISEIILSGLLNDLSTAELASVICALSCEDNHFDDKALTTPPCKNVRKTINQIKDIRRKITFLERDHNIENTMNLNTQFCSLIEYWVANNLEEEQNSATTWDNMFADCDFSQGDVVRAFKRTIDLLRQITIVENTTSALIENAKDAIRAINKEPVNVD
jgi:superfamily II RNA helicase